MVSLFPPPCPQLPDFQRLLVRGAYHASAPIHLLLSHTTDDPEARAVLLTPHRESFKRALVELNDQWISQHGGTGLTCSAAQRTEIFYPPTLAHLRLLLSMLHEYDDTLHHAKTTLDTAPTLLVLHEISAYFTAQTSEGTVSAYLSVISLALALSTSWSPRSPTMSRVVVFDSGLARLKLPILRSLSFDDSREAEGRHRGTLIVLLERYFEMEAEFPEGADSEDEMETDERVPEGVGLPKIKALKLRRIQGEKEIESEGEGEVVWTWSESVHVGQDGFERTVFSWDL